MQAVLGMGLGISVLVGGTIIGVLVERASLAAKSSGAINEKEAA